MERLKEIQAICKASVSISINDHKDYYETVTGYLEPFKTDVEEIDPAVLETMIKLDNMIVIQVYPNTPIGFYKVYHYDLDKAIDETLEILRGLS